MMAEKFGWDLGVTSRAAKARVAAKAMFREIVDPNYEPWEEVSDASNLSDSEDTEVVPVVCRHPSRIANNFLSVEIGESSRSTSMLEVHSSSCAHMTSNIPNYHLLGASGSVVKPMEIDEDGTVLGCSNGMVRARSLGSCQRRRKVRMGRGFLLVDRGCLVTGRTFNFYHMPSLSVVEVKVMEPVAVANYIVGEVPMEKSLFDMVGDV